MVHLGIDDDQFSRRAKYADFDGERFLAGCLRTLNLFLHQRFVPRFWNYRFMEPLVDPLGNGCSDSDRSSSSARGAAFAVAIAC